MGFFSGLGRVITGIGQISWAILEAACYAVALVVYGLFTLAEHGLNWAKKQYQKFGSRFKKQITIDPPISEKLKAFLEGQPTQNGGTLHLSSSVKNADTVTAIAQDENNNVLAFEFVETKGGCDVHGIVEQEID